MWCHALVTPNIISKNRPARFAEPSEPIQRAEQASKHSSNWQLSNKPWHSNKIFVGVAWTIEFHLLQSKSTKQKDPNHDDNDSDGFENDPLFDISRDYSCRIIYPSPSLSHTPTTPGRIYPSRRHWKCLDPAPQLEICGLSIQTQ